jgi:hypothetical protein
MGVREAAQADSGSLHVLVNGTHIDLVVTAGEGVAALRSVTGSAVNGAEENTGVRGRLARELRITWGRLPEQIRAGVRQARFIGPRESAEAALEAAHSELQRLGLQAIVPASPRTESGSKEAAAGGPGMALAAAKRHLQGGDVLFEFLSPETSDFQAWLQRFDTRRHRWIVAVVLACIILPAVIFLVRARVEGKLQSQWARMRPAVAELEGLQNQLRQFRPWFERSTPSVHRLGALVAAFPETGEVWAKNVEINEDQQVACAGFARTQADWLEFLDRLAGQPGVVGLQVQSLRGDNPIQFALGFSWERSHEP